MTRARVLFTALVAAAALFAAVPRSAADVSGFLPWIFGNVDFLSPEQETEISDRVASEIESQQPLVRDRTVADYVSKVGDRLAQTVRRREFPYRFRVVGDRSINAFGIGGGRFYVHAGTLTALDTEGEFASVLAHEIGHQVNRHIAKMYSRQALFQTLAQAAVGSRGSQWVQLAESLGITTGQLYFGREAEREADATMVDILVAAAYDPRESLRLFDKLSALERGGGSGLGAIFSSHPPSQERSQAVSAKIARLRLPSRLYRDAKSFHEIRQRLGSR